MVWLALIIWNFGLVLWIFIELVRVLYLPTHLRLIHLQLFIRQGSLEAIISKRSLLNSIKTWSNLLQAFPTLKNVLFDWFLTFIYGLRSLKLFTAWEAWWHMIGRANDSSFIDGLGSSCFLSRVELVICNFYTAESSCSGKLLLRFVSGWFHIRHVKR